MVVILVGVLVIGCVGEHAFAIPIRKIRARTGVLGFGGGMWLGWWGICWIEGRLGISGVRMVGYGDGGTLDPSTLGWGIDLVRVDGVGEEDGLGGRWEWRPEGRGEFQKLDGPKNRLGIGGFRMVGSGDGGTLDPSTLGLGIGLVRVDDVGEEDGLGGRWECRPEGRGTSQKLDGPKNRLGMYVG